MNKILRDTEINNFKKNNLDIETNSENKIYEDVKTETTQSNLPFRNDEKKFKITQKKYHYDYC